MPTALRTSPAYPSHVDAGAVFREKNGWHRVDYFGVNDPAGDPSRRPIGPTGRAWSPAVEAEHRSTRERVGLFDVTSFGKLEVCGPDAGALLEHVCSNRVDSGPGTVTYTQMLNESGGVIADVTVTHVAEQEYLVVTGTSALDHDLEWLRSHTGGFPATCVRNATSSWACFGVWGPLARTVLAPLTGVGLESVDFPYMTMRTGQVGDAPARLVRLTFVGELGWEIYVPTEFGRYVWDLLVEATNQAGGLRCGYRAIDSLRVEKGYLYLGADLRADRTPVAAGLGQFVRPDKDFIGSEAVRRDTVEERLRCLVLQDCWEPLAGGEPVRQGGTALGRVTSGGLGYTIGSSVAFAYLPSPIPDGETVEVDLGDRWVPAQVTRQPLYDPTGSRIRA